MIDLNDFEATGDVRIKRLTPEQVEIRKIRRKLQAHAMDGTEPTSTDRAFFEATLELIHGRTLRAIKKKQQQKIKQEQAA